MAEFVSIDIETTGLNPKKHQVLEFAAVYWQNDELITDQPWFRYIIDPGRITGDPKALEMNANLIEAIANGAGLPLGYVLTKFKVWLLELGISPDNRGTIVGKNFGSFDLQFLKRSGVWPDNFFSHRILDVGSLYATIDGIPKTEDVCEASIPGEQHEALYDARFALEAVRMKWNTSACCNTPVC